MVYIMYLVLYGVPDTLYHKSLARFGIVLTILYTSSHCSTAVCAGTTLSIFYITIGNGN
jgi:hypothetical protein